MADHVTDPATQFEALARAATQGTITPQKYEPDHDGSIWLESSSGGLRDGPFNMADYVEPADADFIAFCFNHRAQIAAALRGGEDEWMDIASAPKGGGADLVTDPAYVKPPHILLWFPGDDDPRTVVARWDAFYGPDGSGRDETGGLGWVEATTGEPLFDHCGVPTMWRPLPPSPGAAGE